MHRSTRFALTSVLVALSAAGVASAPAAAAQRLEKIDLPSAKGYVKVDGIRLNKTNVLQANVLLPDGYDANPTKAWPVVYLLSGVSDNMEAWNDPTKGNVQRTAKGLPAIVVMPEAGRGYFMDWWQGGSRNNPQWERYYLEEVVPAIESKYRILPGRANHTIGGISMGAYGGVQLSGQFPSYFGTALSFSGLLNSQSPEAVNVLPIDIRSPYQKIWGPPTSPYARAHNPMRNLENLRGTRVYVSSGSGTVRPDLPSNIGAYTTGVLTELSVKKQSVQFVDRAKAEGVEAHYSGHVGVHDWPYWRLELRRAISWGLFKTPKVATTTDARQWTYKTMAPRGNAWGLGYRFADKTRELATFKRDGQSLSVKGAGTLTITPGALDTDASGNGTRADCSFTAKLPFERTLPAGC